MVGRPALFPEPAPDIPALSKTLAACQYRLGPGDQARWIRINVKTLDCMECAHLQHETRGAFGPRRQAKRRRIGPEPDFARLDLCRAHALVWEQRDETDSNPKGTT